MSVCYDRERRAKNVRVAMYAPFLYYWMVDLAKEIARMVGETRFYTTGIYGNYPLKELEKDVFTVPRYKIAEEYFAHPRLLRDIIKWRPRLLILLATESLTSIILYAISRLLGTYVLLIVEENNEKRHDYIFVELLAKAKRYAAKTIYRHAKILIAESDASMEFLCNRGVPRERAIVMTHGTNVEYFNPRLKDQAFARSIGISQSKLQRTVILFVGEFSEYKGAEYLVKAILDVSDNSNILFLIPSIGQVFAKYGSRLITIENVHIYPQLPNMDDMPKLYSLADIVVAPSKSYENNSSDRSPNSVIEAMACGKAVIGSNAGGIPTIMGDAGIIIPPNDPRAIASAILDLAADKRLVRKLGEKARKRAIEVLNNKEYANKLINVYAAASL